MIRYILKEDTKTGPWISEETFEAREPHHVAQAVLGGWSGSARWAVTPEGAYLYGVDRKGHVMHGPPA